MHKSHVYIYFYLHFCLFLQSKALIPLQTEAHPETKQKVLTNYMFPQQPRHDEGMNMGLYVLIAHTTRSTSGGSFIHVCVQIISLTVTALILLCGRSRDSRG